MTGLIPVRVTKKNYKFQGLNNDSRDKKFFLKDSNLKIILSSYCLSEEVRRKVAEIFKIVSEKNKYSANLFLVGKRKSRELNSLYGKVNKATDVLSFPFHYYYNSEIQCLGEVIDLGDIFICLPIVEKQCKENNRSVEEEFCFLFVHGLLHLLGYDHEEEIDRLKMFNLQDKVLSQLVFD
jgi:probable rRNA maturation factor